MRIITYYHFSMSVSGGLWSFSLSIFLMLLISVIIVFQLGFWHRLGHTLNITSLIFQWVTRDISAFQRVFRPSTWSTDLIFGHKRPTLEKKYALYLQGTCILQTGIRMNSYLIWVILKFPNSKKLRHTWVCCSWLQQTRVCHSHLQQTWVCCSRLSLLKGVNVFLHTLTGNDSHRSAATYSNWKSKNGWNKNLFN